MHGKTRPAARSLFALAFAGVPQVSRETFWCLRESRKSLEKLFGVCGSPASLSRNFLVFAGVPQVSRETFWRLRESCKSLEKLFGVCGSPASNKKCFSAFAEVPQATKSTFQHLRKFRRAFPKTFWPSRGICRSSLPALCFRRTHVFYMCFRCRPATEGRLQPIPIHVVILNALLAHLLASGREAPR